MQKHNYSTYEEHAIAQQNKSAPLRILQLFQNAYETKPHYSP